MKWQKMKFCNFGSVLAFLPLWASIQETFYCYLYPTSLKFPAIVLVLNNLDRCSQSSVGLQTMDKPEIPDLIPDQTNLSRDRRRGRIKEHACLARPTGNIMHLKVWQLLLSTVLHVHVLCWPAVLKSLQSDSP